MKELYKLQLQGKSSTQFSDLINGGQKSSAQ